MFRLAYPQHDVDLEPRARALAFERDTRAFLTKPDQACICTRSWRKPLRPDMQRLEQVRLARTVRSRDEH